MEKNTGVAAGEVQEEYTDKKVRVKADCFDLDQIMDSGQCFRIIKTAQDMYRVTAQNKTVKVRKVVPEGVQAVPACAAAGTALDAAADIRPKRRNIYEFFCPEEEYTQFWRHYFDLETDYRVYEKMIDEDDKYLQASFAYGSGIRILNQDPWEMLITFIISQRKNIPAIRQAVEAICRRCGDCTDECEGIYAFPTAGQLAALSLEELGQLSLGYRAKYIYDTAKRAAAGEIVPQDWKNLSDEELRRELMSYYGVGVKVANCVALFGCHRTGAFPVDVWVDRIQKAHYDGRFPVENYPGIAGVMQQYMFFYERTHSGISG